MAVLPTDAASGMPGQRRLAGLTSQMPLTTRTSSGSSFAIVITSTTRTPGFTPRTLTLASSANSAAITRPRTAGAAAAGHNAPIDPANALDTDATANVAIRKYSTPARKPTNGPNAVST